MFFFLALGVAVSYFVLGWSSNVVSFVSDVLPRPHFTILTFSPLANNGNVPQGIFSKRLVEADILL
jgi:hypothetical protein